MAQDARQLRDRASNLIAAEFDLGSARRTLPKLLREPLRVRVLTALAKGLVGRETGRFATLRHSPGVAVLDPRPDLVQLADSLRRLPQILQLDRRPLGEPDDLQHRTDLDDARPEAGWASRILRRILP